MVQVWRQEKPEWCPDAYCVFRRRVMDSICGGELALPQAHEGDINTHRLCFNQEGISFFQVNRTDLDWIRWVMDALDGKTTSWLSKRND